MKKSQSELKKLYKGWGTLVQYRGHTYQIGYSKNAGYYAWRIG